MKQLPIGSELFDKLMAENRYYADKTGFIKDFLHNRPEAALFTRPRRFGKTLMMSMLKSFFSLGSDPSLFDGLLISRETELCKKYQGNYPVIFITLKNIRGETFEDAVSRFADYISRICKETSFLLKSEETDPEDKEVFQRLHKKASDITELSSSLDTLMRMLKFHYHKKVVVLIDEYDAPLNEAYYHGYSEKMTEFIRSFLGDALKTNASLEFAVLTGCFRISRESIFSGLNNFVCDTISDIKYAKYFGFTKEDVKQMLAYYGLADSFGRIKEWYDGYLFGREEMYCPWDVVNYVDSLMVNPDAAPGLFWINTSSNHIIRDLIDRADTNARADLEELIDGKSIEKELSLELTYDSLGNTDLLWSALYLSGYLTLGKSCRGALRGNVLFCVPNKEIRDILVKSVGEWFRDNMVPSHCAKIMECLFHKKPDGLQELLNHILITTISFYDYKEDYYHALITGLLLGAKGYRVRSNRESGLGRADITVEDLKADMAVIIEIKRAGSATALETSCQKALEQIEKERYADPFLADGYRVLKYGISFYKKRCRVKLLESK